MLKVTHKNCGELWILNSTARYNVITVFGNLKAKYEREKVKKMDSELMWSGIFICGKIFMIYNKSYIFVFRARSVVYEILEAEWHTVLGLPHYHSMFNPIEHVWLQAKGYYWEEWGALRKQWIYNTAKQGQWDRLCRWGFHGRWHNSILIYLRQKQLKTACDELWGEVYICISICISWTNYRSIDDVKHQWPVKKI